MNPTQSLDISFNNYVNTRKRVYSAHLVDGIPDYSYATDYEIRKKINSIPGVYAFFKAMTKYVVPYLKQSTNLNALQVGPNQFKEVYDITGECARRLGIGVPQVYIIPDVTTINAMSYAVEDAAPLICVTSALFERFTIPELKAVIGHECGHIHNNHSIYNIAAEVILNNGLLLGIGLIPGFQQILQLISKPLYFMFQAWSRAAEVTADRAGMICCDDPKDVINVDAKFLYGGAFGNYNINVDELEKQFEKLRSTPVRLLELDSSHPVPVRRIFASKEFLQSQVLYTWRPEWKKPDMKLYSKKELDERCDKYISVLKGSKK